MQPRGILTRGGRPRVLTEGLAQFLVGAGCRFAAAPAEYDYLSLTARP